MNTRLLYLFYFLSGLTALVYEVVWARKLGLIFGVDAYGVATVLAVFFTGLGIGSFLFGRIIDKMSLRAQRGNLKGIASSSRHVGAPRNDRLNPLFLYGLLELGIGLYAAVTPLVFKGIEQAQVYVWQQFSPGYGGFNIVTFFLSLFALIIPTVLMGGTFPVIAKAASLTFPLSLRAEAKQSHTKGLPRRPSINSGLLAMTKTESTSWVGLLYGFNTLGAVIGTLLAGFLLIWLAGMNLTIWLAAAVNLGIGVGAILIGRSFLLSLRGANKVSDKAILSSTRLPRPSLALRARNDSVILFIFLITGFAAIALEVLWTRVLVLAFGTSSYAFAVILAIFLLGIALGSLVGSRYFKKNWNFSILLAISLLILGIIVEVLSAFLGSTPKFVASLLEQEDFSYFEVIVSAVLISFVVIIVPTILMGVNFVFGLRLIAKDKNAGEQVGKAYSINTIGGVFGALIAGFLFLPILGIQKSILVVSASYFFASILVFFWIIKAWKLRFIVVAIGLVMLLGGFFFPAWNRHVLTSGVAVYLRDYKSSGVDFEQAVARGEILFYKEGLLSTVTVKKAPEGFLFLRGDGKTDASTDQDLDDLHLIGHIPMILHKNPKNALVIGMGSGITLGSVAAYKSEHIYVVEIEKAMVEAAEYFKEYNHNVLQDPRLTIVNADARAYLRASNKQHDVITSQPSNLWVRGNANLFTREFFELAKSKLTDEGLMLQWVPFYGLSQKEFKTILKTFSSVFPYITVWSPVVSHDVLLVGSKQAQEFDFELVDKRIKSEPIQKDLKDAAITSAEQLIAHYLFDEKKLRGFVRNTKLHTDDKPILEFSAPFSLYQDTIGENIVQLGNLKGDYADHFTSLNLDHRSETERAKDGISILLGAKVKASLGKLEEAALDFESALKMVPKLQAKKELSRLYFELAKRAHDINDLAETVSYFEKSVNAYPNAQTYLNLSIIYLSQNRIKKAKDALEKAKRLEPANLRIPEIEKSINLM